MFQRAILKIFDEVQLNIHNFLFIQYDGCVLFKNSVKLKVRQVSPRFCLQVLEV